MRFTIDKHLAFEDINKEGIQTSYLLDIMCKRRSVAEENFDHGTLVTTEDINEFLEDRPVYIDYFVDHLGIKEICEIKVYTVGTRFYGLIGKEPVPFMLISLHNNMYCVVDLLTGKELYESIHIKPEEIIKEKINGKFQIAIHEDDFKEIVGNMTITPDPSVIITR
jgi:hypothetical protein